MPPRFVPERRDEPEWMDAPGLDAAEVEHAYRVLRRVNRWFFGGVPSLRRELDTFLADARVEPGSSVSLLDVGSGSGDLAAFASDWLRDRGLRPVAVALDRDPTALRLASGSGLRALRADALRLPLGDGSVDVAMAVKFAHHFRGEGLVRLVSELARVARRRVVVLDLRRSWLAYWGFVAWSRLFTRSRLVRHDGPVSVLRGFLPEELMALSDSAAHRAAASGPPWSWEIRAHAGFQLALIGRRSA
jgi:SAM-dependent methyltransferase